MQEKLSKQKYKISIQYCKSCDTHNWCTHHDQQKYRQAFADLCNALKKQFSEIQILGNQAPSHYVPIKAKQNKYFDSINKKYVLYPGIGSFQVYFNDILIFSKKNTNLWPNQKEIIKSIHSKIKGQQVQSVHQRPFTQPSKDYISEKQQKQTVRLANNILRKLDNTHHNKNKQVKQFSLTDHFKRYKMKKSSTGLQCLYAQSQTGKYGKISKITAEDIQKLNLVWGKKQNLPNFIKNKAFIQQKQGKKEMLVNLASIQQQSQLKQIYVSAPKATKSKISNLQIQFERLQSKFSKIENRVSQVNNKKFQFDHIHQHKQFRKKKSDLRSNLLNKINQVKTIYNQQKLIKQIKDKKKRRIQEYIHSSSKQKNEKLQQIYGPQYIKPNLAFSKVKLLERSKVSKIELNQNKRINSSNSSNSNERSDSFKSDEQEQNLDNQVTPKKRNISLSNLSKFKNKFSSTQTNFKPQVMKRQIYTRQKLSSSPKNFQYNNNNYNNIQKVFQRQKKQFQSRSVLHKTSQQLRNQQSYKKSFYQNSNGINCETDQNGTGSSNNRISNSESTKTKVQLKKQSKLSKNSNRNTKISSNGNIVHQKSVREEQKQDKTQSIDQNYGKSIRYRDKSKDNRSSNKDGDGKSRSKQKQISRHKPKDKQKYENRNTQNSVQQNEQQSEVSESQIQNSSSKAGKNNKLKNKNHQNTNSGKLSRVSEKQTNRQQKSRLTQGSKDKQRETKHKNENTTKKPKQSQHTNRSVSSNNMQKKQLRNSCYSQSNRSLQNSRMKNKNNKDSNKNKENTKRSEQNQKISTDLGKLNKSNRSNSTNKSKTVRQGSVKERGNSKNKQNGSQVEKQRQNSTNKQAINKQSKSMSKNSNKSKSKSKLHNSKVQKDGQQEQQTQLKQQQQQQQEQQQKQSEQQLQQDEKKNVKKIKKDKLLKKSKQNSKQTQNQEQSQEQDQQVEKGQQRQLTVQEQLVQLDNQAWRRQQKNIGSQSKPRKIYQIDDQLPQMVDVSVQVRLSDIIKNQKYSQTLLLNSCIQQFKQINQSIFGVQNANQQGHKTNILEKQNLKDHQEQSESQNKRGSNNKPQKETLGETAYQKNTDKNKENYNSQDNTKSRIAQKSKNKNSHKYNASIIKQFYGDQYKKYIEQFHQNQHTPLNPDTNTDKNIENFKYKTIESLYQNQPKKQKQAGKSKIFDKQSIQYQLIAPHSVGRFTNLLKIIRIICSRNQYLIIRLFQNANQSHLDHGVWLCQNYIWKCYNISSDHQVKADQSSYPLHFHHTGLQKWPVILFEALSLRFGGYDALSKASIPELFHTLTGSNYISFKIKQDPQKNSKMLKFITKNQKKNFIITAEKRMHTSLGQSIQSNVQAPVYYILSQKIVNSHEVLLRMKKNNSDAFWIKLQKFVNQFSQVNVLQLRINHNFCYMNLQDCNNGHFKVIQIIFKQQCFGCISAVTQSKQTDFKLHLYKEQQNSVLRLVGQASQKNKKSTFFDCCFQQGKYFAFADIKSSHNFLSYMGEGQPELTLKQEVHQNGLKSKYTQYIAIDDMPQSKKQQEMPKFLNMTKKSQKDSQFGLQSAMFSNNSNKKHKSGNKIEKERLKEQFVKYLINN